MNRLKRVRNRRMREAAIVYQNDISTIVQGPEPDNSWRERVREIVPPIWFDKNGTHFFDADGKMIAQIRGWGGLTSSGIDPNEAATIQTAWGILFAKAVNTYIDQNPSALNEILDSLQSRPDEQSATLPDANHPDSE